MVYKVRRKLLSQNFLYSRTLISSLIRKSSIGPQDIVLEIGSGKGFITAELTDIAKKVISLELDEKLVFHLRSFLGNKANLEVHQADFLNFPLPGYPYKVFANVPFSIEGQIIRKLLDGFNQPDDCYLIIDKRLALHLSGLPKENKFSLKHKPWLDFSIHHYFKRSDFIPIPEVDSVMWRITKKPQPIFLRSDYKRWERFIDIGFGQGGPVYKNLKHILSQEQLSNLSKKLQFSLKVKPSYLTFEQWLQIYFLIYKNNSGVLAK